MTNLNLEQLEQAKIAAKLDPIRKSQIKQHLLTEMENNPVRIGIFARLTQYRILTFVNSKNFSPAFLTAVLAVIFLSAGAGTTFASNESLPGELLYPVKIHITEKVKVAFAVSAEAKAEAKLVQLDHRIEEGTELASKGKLSAETVAQLEARIADYQSDLAKIYENLAQDQKLSFASSISARLAAMINVHEHALAKFTDDEDNNNFRASLHQQLNETNKARSELVGTVVQDSQHQDQFKVAAENKINAAEKVLAQATRYVEQTSAKGITANMKASGDAQLALAEAKLEAARTEHQNGKYTDAFLSANETIKLAQQARAVIHIGYNLQVDVDVTTDQLDSEGNSGQQRSGEVRGSSDKPESPRNDNGRGLQLKLGL